MLNEIEDLKERHKGDISTLWKIYEAEKPFYDNFYFRTSLITSISFVLLSLCLKINIYNVLKTICETSLAILPNLLGFNLGAYILIVGFGGTDILAVITKPLKGQNNYSFYQKLNGVLGISVIVQILALFVVFLFDLWDVIQTENGLVSICDNWILIINALTFLFVLTLIIYSFLLLINVVKHVFMFAQTIHLCIYKSELDKHKANKKENSDS